MKLLIFLLTSLILLQVAAGLPYVLTLGNVTVSYDIPALRNGSQVEIASHGDSQLPSFSIPLEWKAPVPHWRSTLAPVHSLQEIRTMLAKSL